MKRAQYPPPEKASPAATANRVPGQGLSAERTNEKDSTPPAIRNSRAFLVWAVDAGFLPPAYRAPDGAHSSRRRRHRMNDTTTPARLRPSFPVLLNPAELATRPPPPREWMIDSLLPAHRVRCPSTESAHGEARQVAAGAANGRRGRRRHELHGLRDDARAEVMFISAEDDADELHRRLFAVCQASAIDAWPPWSRGCSCSTASVSTSRYAIAAAPLIPMTTSASRVLFWPSRTQRLPTVG